MKIFVPGRICLFGEHSDWAGGYRRINAEIEKGYTLITGTNQGVYAEITSHPDMLVMSATDPDGNRIGPHSVPMKADALLHSDGAFLTNCVHGVIEAVSLDANDLPQSPITAQIADAYSALIEKECS